MKPIIRVENISKQYKIGAQQKPYLTLRESLMETVRAPLNLLKRNGASANNKFWALKDVNFEVMPGEVVGIIGRNGAGKSTLLKVLSRITEPTKGKVELYGRVGSLLEVGTGFHPELTGRENIFLNGTILGMKREEIVKKFDEIVDFAEIEKFIDTPVKHYSSGMYTRLAFAVASHLEPEILIVDEVLAVGDTRFQKKCLGKIEKIGGEGRTVLFVTHNMAVVRQLCRTSILLEKGHVKIQDKSDAVLSKYARMNEEASSEMFVSEYGIRLHSTEIIDKQTGEITNAPVFNENYELKFRFSTSRSLEDAVIVTRIIDELGNRVSSVCSFEEGLEPFLFDRTVDISFPLPKLQLYPGSYSVTVLVGRPNDKAYFEIDRCLNFEIQPAVVHDAPWAYQKIHGVTRISDGCNLSFIN